MLIPKQEIIRDKKHRRYIARLCCCVTGQSSGVQAAHIRSGTGGGAGLKPSDKYCVPLHWREHAEQHRIGEFPFWEKYGGIEKAKHLALDLYAVSGNEDKGLELIRGFIDGTAIFSHT